MPSKMVPSAEWISVGTRRAVNGSSGGFVGSCTSAALNGTRQQVSSSRSPISNCPHAGCAENSNSSSRSNSSRSSLSATGGTATSPEASTGRQERRGIDACHRGSGGLIRGNAVFCLPPDSGWFQGHFAYAARGGCTASLGVLGTELPVDPCMQCCDGGFSRFRLDFIHHECGKEASLVVERYGGNMMSLHAEAHSQRDAGAEEDGADSELTFQTHVMKADDDARKLLDRYFQSVVRAASDPEELRNCIVCIGQMDVPLSLLQDLAAPLPDGSRPQSMVCSAFSPCREAPPNQPQRGQTSEPTPVLSPCPHREGAALSSRRINAVSSARHREEGGGDSGAAASPAIAQEGAGPRDDNDWL